MENIELTLTQNEFVKLMLFIQEIGHESERLYSIKPSYMDPGVVSKLSVAAHSEFVYSKINSQEFQLQMFFDNVLFNTFTVAVSNFNYFIKKLFEYQSLKNYICR